MIYSNRILQGSLMKGVTSNWSSSGSWVARYFRVFGHYLQYYNDRSAKKLRGVVDLQLICGCWLHPDMSEPVGSRTETVINVAFSHSKTLPASLSADLNSSSMSAKHGRAPSIHVLASHGASTIQLKAETPRTAQEWADIFMEYLLDNMKRWTPAVSKKVKKTKKAKVRSHVNPY